MPLERCDFTGRRSPAGFFSCSSCSTATACSSISEIIASKVDAHYFAEAGYEITADEVTRRFAGLTSRMIVDIVAAEIGHPLPDDFFEKTKREIDRRLATELKAVPGALEVLERLDGPRCVCSNSTSERLKISLEKTHLYDRFKPYIFSAVEVGDKRPKPAPDVYLYAMKEFAVDPREAMVIEDSIFGVQAAKAAGARASSASPAAPTPGPATGIF